MENYEYKIKEEIFRTGEKRFTPVARSIPLLSIFKEDWRRIIKLYDKYALQELDFHPDLTKEQCQEHIEGFKKELLDRHNSKLVETILHDII